MSRKAIDDHGPKKEMSREENSEATMKATRGMLNLWTGIVPVLALTGSIALLAAGCPAFADDGLSPSQQPNNAAETETSAFANRTQELSYALGMNLGNRLRSHAVDVDMDFLVQGLQDARSGGTTLLTVEQVRAPLSDLQSEVTSSQTARGSKNKQEGEAFLAENKAQEGVITLESGLQYKILKAGDGPKPTMDDTVVAHYRGTLIDGRVFDSSYQRGQPSTLSVKGVIAGWREALQLMPVGSRWQLFIPAGLAYGDRVVDEKIGPNAALVFEVELISIEDSAGGVTMAAASGDSAMAEVSATVKQASSESVVPAGALADIKISYKVDPRITKSLYMGERWASPRIYNCVNAGTTCTVEARVEGFDAKGAPIKATPEWIPADPKIVTVTPDRGNVVKITVLQAGETSLKVTAGEFSKELFITAKYDGNKIKAGISRVAPSPQ
jgi:FKBP-type peptidyl-prolyl cis-trans isomerase FklB